MKKYSISFESDSGNGAFTVEADNREDARRKAQKKLRPGERITSIIRLDENYKPYYKIGGGYV